MCEHSYDDPVQRQQRMDQQHAWLHDTIRRHGWAVMAICGDDDAQRPGFAYTVGLSGFGHPELVVFGLDRRHAGRVLNELGERVRSGGVLADGDELTAESINPPDLRLFDLPTPSEVLLWAEDLYGDEAPIFALQVVYADFRGTFPWEPNYCYPQWLQPMPGTFAA